MYWINVLSIDPLFFWQKNFWLLELITASMYVAELLYNISLKCHMILRKLCNNWIFSSSSYHLFLSTLYIWNLILYICTLCIMHLSQKPFRLNVNLFWHGGFRPPSSASPISIYAFFFQSKSSGATLKLWNDIDF